MELPPEVSQSNTARLEPSSASCSRSRALLASASARCSAPRRRPRTSSTGETAASVPATRRTWKSESFTGTPESRAGRGGAAGLSVREPVVDDLHRVAHVEAGRLPVVEVARPAVLYLHHDLVRDRLVAVLLDLVAGVGSARRARDGRHRVAAAAADLVAEHAAGDAADHGAGAARFPFLLDLPQVHDAAALLARGGCIGHEERAGEGGDGGGEDATGAIHVSSGLVETGCANDSTAALARSALRGLELREEDHVADRRAVGEEHHQPVDADAFAGGRRKPVLERADV